MIAGLLAPAQDAAKAKGRAKDHSQARAAPPRR